jgi:hypothetical protein
MPRTEKYFIGPQLLGDIRRTVDRVDAGAYGEGATPTPPRLQDTMRRSGTILRRGTFTAASWSIGETAVVTILGETNTVSVTNYCIPVAGETNATQTLNVIYGNILGTATAVEIQQPTSTCTNVIGGVDLTEISGFDAGAIQLLGHSAGDTNAATCVSLQWYSVTQCGSTAT